MRKWTSNQASNQQERNPTEAKMTQVFCGMPYLGEHVPFSSHFNSVLKHFLMDEIDMVKKIFDSSSRAFSLCFLLVSHRQR